MRGEGKGEDRFGGGWAEALSLRPGSERVMCWALMTRVWGAWEAPREVTPRLGPRGL